MQLIRIVSAEFLNHDCENSANDSYIGFVINVQEAANIGILLKRY